MANISRLEEQANLLFNNVAGWETSTLQRIGKRIGKYGKMSLADVKAINNIAVVKQDMDAITKELAKVMGLNISQIEQMYTDLITEQHFENEPLYDYRNKTFVPFADNRELQALVRAYSKTTAETMINLAKTKALSIYDHNGNTVGLQRYYTNVLDKAVMQVASGATDFHTAMRDSIVELGGSGIRVDYGGGVTRRLDTVVRQNLLWGAKQASMEYDNMIGEELGCSGIEIDYHSNSRPSHEFMQGKQYILGKSKTINGIHFQSADRALKALNDYGCRHYKKSIICGVSEPRYSPEELERLKAQDKKTYDIDGKQKTGYEASQDMRRLETATREQKRIRDIAKAEGDNVLVKRCNERIKVYQDKYNQISEITGIPKDTKRMSVPKSKNVLTSYTKDDKIKVERKYRRFSMGDEKGYKEWKDNYYSKNTPKLTNQDISALKKYSDGSYTAINGVERFEKGSEAYKKVCRQYGVKNLDRYKKISDNISIAISKFDLDEDIITHRYVNNVDYITGSTSDLEALSKSIGGQYTEKGFFSTCIFENQTKGFGGKTPIHIETRVPKGSKGAYINEFSEKKDIEFEFLIDKGTSFDIVDAGERPKMVTKYDFKLHEWKKVEEIEKYMILEVLK